MITRLSIYAKLISITTLISITSIMTVATILEKRYGTEFVAEHIYSSPVFIALWGIAGLSSMMYIIKKKLHKKLYIFTIHVAFAVILAGALVTHIKGEQGYIHLRKDSKCCYTFTTFDNRTIELPFTIKLDYFSIKNYPGTQSPMDYVSKITIADNNTIKEGCVSMNNVLKYRNYRFYQSGFDEDKNGTTLSVYHDPYGIAITYSGYFLLLVGMIMFFLEKHSIFRKLIKSEYIRRVNLMLVMILSSLFSLSAKDSVPQTVPSKIAEALGSLNL